MPRGLALLAAALLLGGAPQALAGSHEVTSTRFRLNNLDWGGSSDGDRFSWDFDARVGTLDDRIFLRTEGTQLRGRTEDAELQLFYNRRLSEFWDVNIGWRRDFNPTNRNYGAFGFSGIAPYFFEVEATAYVSEEGTLSARLELSTDLLIARQVFGDNGPGLYLRPSVDTNLAAADDRELGTRAGITDVKFALQARYEFTPRIAPYVELGWERQLGATANARRQDGERPLNSYLVLGIRSTF